MTERGNGWWSWGLRSAAVDRLWLSLSACAVLWLLGAWAMDWL
jgi:hypothetical protein